MGVESVRLAIELEGAVSLARDESSVPPVEQAAPPRS
jgi:hypothetical protein